MKIRKIAVHSLFIAIVFAVSLPAQEMDPARNIRGISFQPSESHTVANAVSIEVPRACKKMETIHRKEKYPISFFTADCGGRVPCFTLSVAVMVIPASLRSYEDIIVKSEREDFGKGERKPLPARFIQTGANGASKTAILTGNSYALGNHIVGYYYNDEKKITSKVLIGLSYVEKFTDDEWRHILVSSIGILRSVKFVK